MTTTTFNVPSEPGPDRIRLLALELAVKNGSGDVIGDAREFEKYLRGSQDPNLKAV